MVVMMVMMMMMMTTMRVKNNRFSNINIWLSTCSNLNLHQPATTAITATTATTRALRTSLLHLFAHSLNKRTLKFQSLQSTCSSLLCLSLSLLPPSWPTQPSATAVTPHHPHPRPPTTLAAASTTPSNAALPMSSVLLTSTVYLPALSRPAPPASRPSAPRAANVPAAALSPLLANPSSARLPSASKR